MEAHCSMSHGFVVPLPTGPYYTQFNTFGKLWFFRLGCKFFQSGEGASSGWSS